MNSNFLRQVTNFFRCGHLAHIGTRRKVGNHSSRLLFAAVDQRADGVKPIKKEVRID